MNKIHEYIFTIELYSDGKEKNHNTEESHRRNTKQTEPSSGVPTVAQKVKKLT